jgi:exodeoxyribonuclease III
MSQIKLLSWNINGLRAVHRKGLLLPVFDLAPDILCLQETKAAEDQVPPDLLQLAGYRAYFSAAERKGYSGVGVFSRIEPVEVRRGIGIPELDCEGRFLIVDYGRFLLFNVYFPNGGASEERLRYKLEFYRSFLGHIESERRRGRSVVVCGDVNTAHREIDLARPKENQRVSGFLPEERAWIDELLDRGYLDTFRLFNAGPGHYTWWDNKTRARERNVGWRIDSFYVSEDLRDNVHAACIYPDIPGSDHCPIGLELEFKS